MRLGWYSLFAVALVGCTRPSMSPDVARVRELATTAGCAFEWRVVGPFGPRDLLGFDTAFPPEAAGPLAETYDLGPGRGTQPTRAHEARGCAVHLGGGAVVNDVEVFA